MKPGEMQKMNSTIRKPGRTFLASWLPAFNHVSSGRGAAPLGVYYFIQSHMKLTASLPKTAITTMNATVSSVAT